MQKDVVGGWEGEGGDDCGVDGGGHEARSLSVVLECISVALEGDDMDKTTITADKTGREVVVALLAALRSVHSS